MHLFLCRSLFVACCLAALTWTAPARAADPSEDRVAQAKALLQEANVQYAVGEFLQAAEKYQAAYKLKPDPALLYNAAQSYRMAGNNEKALLLYKNYVLFYPSAKNVPNVEQQIAKLQEAIAAQEKAKTQPPTTTETPAGAGPGIANGSPIGASSFPTTEPGAATTPPPASSLGAPAAQPPSTTSSPALNVSAPASSASQAEDTPIYKKWWLWTIVGVVAVGAVVTVLAVSGSPSSWNTAPDFGPGASNLVRR